MTGERTGVQEALFYGADIERRKRSGGDTWRRKACVWSKPAMDRILMSGTAPLRAQQA